MAGQSTGTDPDPSVVRRVLPIWPPVTADPDRGVDRAPGGSAIGDSDGTAGPVAW